MSGSATLKTWICLHKTINVSSFLIFPGKRPAREWLRVQRRKRWTISELAHQFSHRPQPCRWVSRIFQQQSQNFSEVLKSPRLYHQDTVFPFLPFYLPSWSIYLSGNSLCYSRAKFDLMGFVKVGNSVLYFLSFFSLGLNFAICVCSNISRRSVPRSKIQLRMHFSYQQIWVLKIPDQTPNYHLSFSSSWLYDWEYWLLDSLIVLQV